MVGVANMRGGNNAVPSLETTPRLVDRAAPEATRKDSAPSDPRKLTLLKTARMNPDRSRPAVSAVATVTPGRPTSIGMKVTAYCICEKCCEGWSKFARTATGDDAQIYDGVAADPKLLPYRTKLDIPGIGIREVDDTGGGMRKSAREGVTHIDVRMPSHSMARQWGVRWLEVKVLKRKEAP